MYKDRGIIKWAPFDALIGFHGLINDIVEKRNRIEHPILLEDKLSELNETFTKVLNENKLASYLYYEKGYIKETYGNIIKFDRLTKKIKLDNLLFIRLEDILEINIIN